MENFAHMHFKPEALADFGLPDIPYPIPAAAIIEVIEAGGDLPLSLMLYGLQEQSDKQPDDWQSLEAAINRLSSILTEGDERTEATAQGDEWWLAFGPMDMNKTMVTIQRQGLLIAAMQPTEEGRLKVVSYRPLNGYSVKFLIDLARNPHPTHGVLMRDNNWEYALDRSCGNGNIYLDMEGASYLSYWEFGVGISSDGSHLEDWYAQRDTPERPPALTIAEIGTYYTFCDSIP